MIMTARIRAAESIPTPSGGPEKNGRLRAQAGVSTSSFRTSGTRTKTPQRPRRIPSPSGNRDPRLSVAGPGSSASCALRVPGLQLDLLEGLQLEGDDLLRKRGVPELGAVLLAVSESPLKEVGHDLRACLVLRVLEEEHPREGRDRVGVRARRIRDRDAEVGRHRRRGAGGGFRDGLEGGAGQLALVGLA